MMKSVGLDLALIIGVDSDLTILRKDNVSRPRSPRATLVSPRMIMGRTLIQTSGTKSHAFVTTTVRRAI
jgi:hypothetical protein